VLWPDFSKVVGMDIWNPKFVPVGSTRPLGQSILSSRIFVRPCYEILAEEACKLLQKSTQ